MSSFLSALFATLVVSSFAVLFLYRQRGLGWKARLSGALAIFLGACLLFSAMFYVFIEYIYNQGPDDWGAISFARGAVDSKLESHWAKVRILDFSPSFADANYRVLYTLPNGKKGLVICHIDYQSGRFTSAEIQAEK